MSLVKCVSIFDETARVFQMPIYFHNSEEAIRYFSWLCGKDDNPVGRFRLQHHLYDLGEFDTDSGELTSHDVPKLLISGISVDVSES